MNSKDNTTPHQLVAHHFIAGDEEEGVVHDGEINYDKKVSGGDDGIFESQDKMRRNVVGVDVMETTNVAPPSRPSREQSEIAAKNRARAAGRVVRQIGLEDDDVSNDAQAKRRAKAPTGRVVARGGGGNLDTLDRDIDAKTRARRSIMSGAAAARKPPAKLTTAVMQEGDKTSARAGSRDSADATVKRRARPGSGPAMIPGAFGVSMVADSDDEDDIKVGPAKTVLASSEATAKNRARSRGGPAMIPGAVGVGGDDSDDHSEDDIKVGPAKTVFASSETTTKNRARSRDGPALIPGAVEERYAEDTANKLKFEEEIDVDTLVKSRAAAGRSTAPRLIGMDVDDDDDEEDPLAQKKKDAAGVGASCSHAVGFASKNMKDEEDLEQKTKEGAAGVGASGCHTVGYMSKGDDPEQALPEAQPVMEEELDLDYIPHSIEYDPAAKPPMHKNRRFKFYMGAACIAALLVLGILVVVFVGGMKKDSKVEPGPTSAPTNYRESLGIQEQIEKIIGGSKLEDEGTPQAKALEWILHEDPLQLPSDAENLLQRYILAMFYYQTSASGPWRSCNPPKANETADCDFENVVGLSKNLTMTFAPVPNETRWLSDRSECEWVGVTCENDRVIILQLLGAKLSGAFPEELAHLPFLRDIRFAWNELSGTFPKAISHNMRLLDNIELHGNKLSGTIPVELFEFENLERINLGNNHLTGTLTIPSDIPVRSLKSLFLFSNPITGSIPTEIGRISTLRYLRINKSSMSGTIPSEIGLLPYMQELWLHKSGISGSIPSEIGTHNIKDFRVHYTAMTGTIPEEIYNLTSMFRIDLYNNNFTGSISTKIGQLTDLTTLRARFTNLHGPIPSELNELTELRRVWLHNTHLTGEIPGGVCELRNSSLVELVTDCMAAGNGFDVSVACPCCTECCNLDLLICQEEV